MSISTNIENYKVSLYNSKLKTSFSTECLQSVCELIDLAPFQYEMTLSKDGYKDYVETISIISWEKLQLKVVLEKQLLIEKIDIPLTQTLADTEKQIEEVRELSFLQKSYKYFLIPHLWYFYFQENEDNSLTLFQKNGQETLNLYSFQKIERAFLDIQGIEQTNNMIFISYWDDKFIYNLSNNSIEKIYFPQKVNYVKQMHQVYHLINDKGTFLYDINTKNIEYFYLFKDFIYYDNEHYLWIIFLSETEKKNNYNLSDLSGNLIVKYNFKTKKIKVLETTHINITKIILENNKVYFYDSWDNKYQVKNI